MSELRRLKQPEEEKLRLKRMVADPNLDKQMLQEVLLKVRPEDEPWSNIFKKNNV